MILDVDAKQLIRVFFIKNTKAVENGDIKNILDMWIKKSATDISTFTKYIPCSGGEAKNIRRLSEPPVIQIEEETSVVGKLRSSHVISELLILREISGLLYIS